MTSVVALPGMEAMVTPDPLAEAQLRSAEARRIFEVEEGYAPWMEDYWRLIGEGWPWRQAVYMLWAGLPAARRRPRTQGELAVEMLGLTSDRRICEWKDNPAMDAEIAKLSASILSKRRAAIYDALAESASNPSPRANSDRRLALEMMGDYSPKVGVTVVPGAVAEDLDELSAEELRALELGPGGDSSRDSE